MVKLFWTNTQWIEISAVAKPSYKYKCFIPSIPHIYKSSVEIMLIFWYINFLESSEFLWYVNLQIKQVSLWLVLLFILYLQLDVYRFKSDIEEGLNYDDHINYIR